MRVRYALAALGALSALAAGTAGAELRVEVSPASPSPGEVFVVRAEGVPDGVVPEATLDGQVFPLWRNATGWEGLGAVDRDARQGSSELALAGVGTAVPLASVAVRVGSRAYPEQRLTVNERMVTLSAEDQERAAREAVVIREVLASRSPERLWSGSFQPPVEGPVSSPFGVRRFYNGKRRGYHSGLDLAAPRGTPVFAAAAGVVALAGDLFYTGNTVFLDHGLGLFTAYFHMDTLAVAEGQHVATAGLLGRVGSTGRSTGAHLHWGVYVVGVKADPLSLVRVTGGAAGGGETP